MANLGGEFIGCVRTEKAERGRKSGLEMAGIWCSSTVSSTLHLRVTVASKIAVYLFWEYVNFFWFRQHLQKRVHGIRCCSTTPDNKEKTPQLLRIAVGGVTELLRLVSFGQNRSHPIFSPLFSLFPEKVATRKETQCFKFIFLLIGPGSLSILEFLC